MTARFDVSPDEALDLIVASARQAAEAAHDRLETVYLTEGGGRVLLEDLASLADRPTGADSALDGFACLHFDTLTATDAARVELDLVGASVAGRPFPGTIGPGQAVAVATGGLVPAGADAVIGVEHAQAQGGKVRVSRPADPKAVRPRAQDMRAGVTYLARGSRLTAAALGLAGAMGHARLTVARRLRVVLVTTGDEVVEPGRTLAAGQVYDANGAALADLLSAAGCEVVSRHHLVDDGPGLALALDRASRGSPPPDLIVTSGGVSRGERDVVRDAMLGAGDLSFWRVTIRPGGPTMFGSYGGVPLLGLAGNPVSSLVGFLVFGRAFTDTWSGLTGPLPYHDRVPVRLEGAFPPERKTVLYRAHLSWQVGTLTATPFANQSSGVLRALVESDALVVVASATGGPDVAAGTASAIDLRRYL